MHEGVGPPEAESHALRCLGTFGREVQLCPHRAEWLLPFTGSGLSALEAYPGLGGDADPRHIHVAV